MLAAGVFALLDDVEELAELLAELDELESPLEDESDLAGLLEPLLAVSEPERESVR